MNLILTSAQEAAFNAAAEAARDIGRKFCMTFYADGSATAYGDLDPDNLRSHFVHGGIEPTGAQAVNAFLKKLSEELAKPVTIHDPVEVKKVAASIVEECRSKDASFDELAERIAAIPVTI